MKSHLLESAKVGNLFLVGPLDWRALMLSCSWRFAVAVCWSVDVLRVDTVWEKAVSRALFWFKMAWSAGSRGWRVGMR